MTTLADLQELGGFVSSELVKKTIAWPRKHLGKEDAKLDVFVRPMTAKVYERLTLAGQEESRLAIKIAALTGWGKKGEESMTEEQAGQLDMVLITAISRAIDEVSSSSGKA